MKPDQVIEVNKSVLQSVSVLKATGHFAGGEANQPAIDNGSVIQEDSPSRQANPDLIQVLQRTNPESLESTTGSKQMSRNMLNNLSTPEAQIYRSQMPVTSPLSPISGITTSHHA